MKRAKPIQRKTRLKSVNRERAAKRKARGFGEYADWIRGRVCAISGRATCGLTTATSRNGGPLRYSEAAHVKSRGAGGHAAGNLVPLCPGHHWDLHRIGRKSFAERYLVDLGAIAADLWGRYQTEIGGNAA